MSIGRGEERASALGAHAQRRTSCLFCPRISRGNVQSLRENLQWRSLNGICFGRAPGKWFPNRPRLLHTLLVFCPIPSDALLWSFIISDHHYKGCQKVSSQLYKVLTTGDLADNVTAMSVNTIVFILLVIGVARRSGRRGSRGFSIKGLR